MHSMPGSVAAGLMNIGLSGKMRMAWAPPSAQSSFEMLREAAWAPNPCKHKEIIVFDANCLGAQTCSFGMLRAAWVPKSAQNRRKQCNLMRMAWEPKSAQSTRK